MRTDGETGFEAVAVTAEDLKDDIPQEVQPESMHDDGPNVDDDAGLSGTDSGPAREFREQAPQERTPDGKFATDPHRSKIPEKTPRETDEAEIRRVLGEESAKATETPNKPKPIDPAKEKGKDPKASKDHAETRSGETTKDGDTEQASVKLSRTERSEAKKALLLDKWTDAEIAKLSDESLKTIAAKATERHAEMKRELEAAKQTAKNGATDHGNRKPATTAKPDADAEPDDTDSIVERMVSESFQAYDEKDPDTGPQNKAFRDGMRAHTKALATKISEELSGAMAELREEMKAEYAKSLTKEVDGMRFQIGLQSLRGRFGQAVKTDKASLDALQSATQALRSKFDTYEEALEAAHRALYASNAVTRDAERQKKVSTAQRAGSADVSARTATAPPPDEKDFIRRELKKGPGKDE